MTYYTKFICQNSGKYIKSCFLIEFYIKYSLASILGHPVEMGVKLLYFFTDQYSYRDKAFQSSYKLPERQVTGVNPQTISASGPAKILYPRELIRQ